LSVAIDYLLIIGWAVSFLRRLVSPKETNERRPTILFTFEILRSLINIATVFVVAACPKENDNRLLYNTVGHCCNPSIAFLFSDSISGSSANLQSPLSSKTMYKGTPTTSIAAAEVHTTKGAEDPGTTRPSSAFLGTNTLE
jgi:hypothetical protein